MICAADNLQPLNPAVSEALRRLDPKPLQEIAAKCERAGAKILDLNPGYLPARHVDRMAFMVEAVQEVTSARLMLDSPNAKVLAKGLSVCREKPILNGLSLEEQKLQEVLPLAAENGTQLVLLLMDKTSFTPSSTEEKAALAIELREHAVAAGMEDELLIFDPILPNLSWHDALSHIGQVVRTVQLLASGALFGEPVQTIVGLSNIRSGLRHRFPLQLELTCLSMLAGAGLQHVLANALEPELTGTLQLINQMGIA